MSNVAYLYSLPISTWQIAADLSTSSVEAINQSELESALHLEWLERQTSQITGAAIALFELEGAVNPATGLAVYTSRNIAKAASDLCERATNAQLSSLAHTAKRAGVMLAEFMAAIANAAESELDDRQSYQVTKSDGSVWIVTPNN
jgi:hypothetical protein